MEQMGAHPLFLRIIRFLRAFGMQMHGSDILCYVMIKARLCKSEIFEGFCKSYVNPYESCK